MRRRPKKSAKSRDELSQHSAIRLSPEMHAKVKALGGVYGYGLGEEIRRRIAESLATEELPIETQRLFKAVHHLCTGQLRDWYRSPALFSEFKRAIADVLDQAAPKKDTTGLLSGAAAVLARENPGSLGRFAALQAISETAVEFSKRQRTK